MATEVIQTAPSSTSNHDYTAINLARLLSRLEAILLNSAPSNTQLRLLRRSQYERNRVAANVEHARTLLLNLEHNAHASAVASSASATSSLAMPSLRLSSKPYTQASSTSATTALDLPALRNRVRHLRRVLDELNHLPPDEREPDPSQFDEDLVAIYASRTTEDANGIAARPTSSTTPAAPAPQSTAAPSATLRSRKPEKRGVTHFDDDNVKATSASGSAHSGTKTASTRAQGGEASKDGKPDARAAQLLEAHDAEQTALTDRMLELSAQLRASAAAVGEQLTSGDPLVERAAAALERNTGSLAKAGARMGALRRMTEGKGWFARMGLYGWIAALWVALVLLVFVLPKLRLR